jgi:carbon-monoxide dehydrogenase small subunit
MSVSTISFTLNGAPCDVIAEPGEMLVDVLREKLGLTGTKVGCGTGGCGACTVILDGVAVNSCLTPMGKIAGRSVVTIEGVATEELHPVQKALIGNGAVQCGFCMPGIVMSSKALLDRNPHPTREEIRTALDGNLCRCTGYMRVEDAVEKAASEVA